MVIATSSPIFDEHMFSAKVDHNLTTNHRLASFFSMNHRQRNNSPADRWGTPPGLPTGVYQLQYTPGRLVRVAEDWTISPRVLNHFAIAVGLIVFSIGIGILGYCQFEHLGVLDGFLNSAMHRPKNGAELGTRRG